MSPSRPLPGCVRMLVCGLLALASCRGDTKDWRVLHQGAELGDDRLSVGQGLTTRLSVTVVSGGAGPFPSWRRPERPVFLPEPGVEVVEAGDACFNVRDEPAPCTDSEALVGGTLIDVTASKEGWTEFSFIADNIEEKGTVFLQVHRLTGVRFHISPKHGPPDIPRLFGGTVTGIRTDFEGEGLIPSTRIALTGTAPLEVVQPAEASGRLRENTLTLGPGPSLYEVKSVVLPEVLTLRVQDVAGIHHLALQAPRTARVNSLLRVQVTPQDGGRNAISGTPPAPFKVESLGVAMDTLVQREYQVDLMPKAAGVATLRVSWGAATAEAKVEVTP